MKKMFFGVVATMMCIGLLASPATANVVPNDSRSGDTVTTFMWCFTGTVTFTITGNGVSIPVGSTVATPPDGKAQLSFRMPVLAPGRYTMVGKGKSCDGDPNYQVNVGFNLLATPDDPQYPPRDRFVALDRSVVAPSGTVVATAGRFVGPVQFRLVETGQDLGAPSAREDGIASVSFAAPATAGTYTVSAIGRDGTGDQASVLSSFLVSAPVVIAPDVPAPRPAPAGVVSPVVAPNAAAATAAPAAVVESAVPVDVAGISITRGSALARTGGDANHTVRLALVAIAIGGALVVGTRRRLTR